MIELEAVVNTQISVPFVANGNATGQTTFSTILLKGGAVDSGTAVTFTEVGQGLYFALFTPTATGDYTLFIETSIAAHITVANKTLFTYLDNIEGGVLGSWSWDKQANTITMYSESGVVIANFNVTSSSSLVSRERV